MPRRSVDTKAFRQTRWGQGSGAKRKTYTHDHEAGVGVLHIGNLAIRYMDAGDIGGLVDLLTHVQVELGLVDPPERDE